MDWRVFISYAQENGHNNQVRELWAFLRNNGIDARFDEVAEGERQDWALWMADQIREADADRPASVRLLERHLHLDDRRVWPTMIRVSGSRVELLRPIAEHLTAQTDENRRRTAFDKVFKDLSPLAIAELATQLRALLPTSHPKDRARRARLEGTLSPYSADARDWVERQLAEGTSRPVASAAIAALGDWSPGGLQETGLPWLTRLLNSPWPASSPKRSWRPGSCR